MTNSEKYEIFIAFIGREIPDIQVIKDIFDEVIKKEYESSSIYVDVAIEEQLLSCVDCSKTEKGYIATAIRNPSRSPDEALYNMALGNIVFKVRKILDSPYTVVAINDADISIIPSN